MKKQVMYSIFLFLLLFISAWMINEQDEKRKNISNPPPSTEQIGLEITSKKNSVQHHKKRFAPREYVKLKTSEK